MGVVPFQKIAFIEYDFYLMTSHYEGFSLGLLEALSQGLYIATTKVGGAEEVTDDNPYSVLLNCDAVADAVAIDDLLQRHGPNLEKSKKYLCLRKNLGTLNGRSAVSLLLKTRGDVGLHLFSAGK